MELPYKLTINVCVNMQTGQSREIIITGATPLIGDPMDEATLLAIMANVLCWQSAAVAQAAGSEAQRQRYAHALNHPINTRPF